ncbi:FtsW/RodA/SpoVE family cell cycle protein [Patescibacteria group bacterium]
MNKSSIFKNHDWFLTLAIFMLVLVGLVVIYSSTFTAQTPVEGLGTINRQFVFVILGFFIYFLISRIDPTYYKYIPVQILTFAVITGLLLYVWLFGDPVRSTNRWIEWGFIRIQPSEYAKIVLILLNSGILANVLVGKVKEEVNWGKVSTAKNWKERISKSFKNIRLSYPVIFIYGLAIAVNTLCIVLILVEPALGNAAITALISISLFLISFRKQKYVLGLALIIILAINSAGNFFNFSFLYEILGFSLILENFDLAVIFLTIIGILLITYTMRLKMIPVILTFIIGASAVFTISYTWENVLKPYQRQRVEAFFNPEEDPQGAGWQLRQAKIAIGSGRVFGKGFLQGSQSKLRYLPEAYSDFIFAAFCEEFGLVGATFVLGVYIFLLIRIVKTARSAQNNYEALICFGVAMMILVHVFINTGMNMGILPITGIPLPLISYGGSSVMVTMIALGLVQAVNMHKDTVGMQEKIDYS